jgi:hypothetical protein
MTTEGPLIEKQQLKRMKPKIIVNFEENKKLRFKKEVSEIICDETSKNYDVKEVATPNSLLKAGHGMAFRMIRHLLNRYESSFFDNERDSMNFERDAENKISVIKQK